MDGSAFVTLGSLYSMVPGWPIAFGNDLKAEQSLKKAMLWFLAGPLLLAMTQKQSSL